MCPAQHPHRGHLRPPSGPFGTLWPHPEGGIWQKAMHRPIGEGPLGRDIAGTPCPTRPSPSPAAPPPAPWQPWPLLWSYLLFALLSCPTPAALNSLPRCWAFLPSDDLDLLQSLFPRRHPTSALSRLLLPRHQLKKPRSLHLTVTPRRVKGMGPRPTPRWARWPGLWELRRPVLIAARSPPLSSKLRTRSHLSAGPQHWGSQRPFATQETPRGQSVLSP